jgi:uncharacterized protein (TIGR03435 family)
MYETLNWKWSVKDLVNSIEDDVEKPVRDETGLKGEYNFGSKSSCPNRGIRFLLGQGAGDAPPCVNIYADDSEGKPLYKRLGFKLEKATVPVETWVIDNVEKPTGN